MSTLVTPVSVLLDPHYGVSRKPEPCRACIYRDIGAGFCPDTDNATTALIGFFLEAPGETEIQQRVPLTGKAGRLWTQKFIEKLGYKREDVFVGNVLRCRPPSNLYPAGVIAARAERRCRVYDERVRQFNPDMFVVAYHPAAILRTPALYRPTLRSVEFAFQAAATGRKPIVLMGDAALSLVAPHLKGGLKKWNRHYWYTNKGWSF